jgi:hypothetical protein
MAWYYIYTITKQTAPRTRRKKLMLLCRSILQRKENGKKWTKGASPEETSIVFEEGARKGLT